MAKLRAFEAIINQVIPDVSDRVRLQMFFGSFLARVSEPPGCLVLCGNGAGAWVINGVIWHMLEGNVSEVPGCDLFGVPDRAVMCAGMQANMVLDMTGAGAWSLYGRTLKRMVVDGRLFEGDDSPAPRLVIQGRYVPTAEDLKCLGGCAVVIRLGMMSRLDFLWSDVMAEMHQIRAWARDGLGMLERDGFGRISDAA